MDLETILQTEVSENEDRYWVSMYMWNLKKTA